MILVDVYVPALDETYDFNMNENVLVGVLIDEISEMLLKLADANSGSDMDGIMLCDYDTERILSEELTLYEQNIKNGAHLFVV